ncbi:MAG: helix-turn-helix transcriptional regulator, partial [Phaeodactylibacter sp.]|nr:helix-turn-helix transcriptional regulator [Phaeodactylibacter sp.]
KQTGRSVSLSPVHSALYRLEEKGYVESELGGATKTRGGRRKRIYQLTAAGRAALDEAKAIRNRLWNMLPD